MGMAQESQDDIWTWLGLRRRPIWAVARPLGGLLAMLAAILFVMALVGAFAVIGRTIVADDATQANLGAGALIVALLGAPFLIWSTVLKHETVRYQKEGLITDRINKAVEQLGVEKTVKKAGVEESEPNIEVRIGAILSLERIAQDSTNHDQGRDHVRVMEILCAYIRQNAPATTARDCPEYDWELLADNADDEQRADEKTNQPKKYGRGHQKPKTRAWAQTLPPPRADIAKALEVLGRRSSKQRQVEAAWPNLYDETITWPFDKECPALPDPPENTQRDPAELAKFQDALNNWRQALKPYSGYRLDLRNTNLQRADLSAKRPDLSDAVFSGAKLHNARMEGAKMSSARLEGAILRDVHLTGASIQYAQIQGADLMSASLQGAFAHGVRLEGAYLADANIKEADLFDMSISCANLSNAHLEGAGLSWAKMEGANLKGVHAEQTNLSYARMERANLIRAHFDAGTNWTSATLIGAAVQSVNFENTKISAEQIATTFGDGRTLLPARMPRPPDWPSNKVPYLDFPLIWSDWLSTTTR